MIITDTLWFVGVAVRCPSHWNAVLRLRRYWNAGRRLLRRT